MYNFLIQAYYSYRGLFLWLNWPSYISNIVGRPVLFVVMFAFLGRFLRDPEAEQAYIIGMSMFSIPVIILGGVLQSFYRERVLGTLSVIFASPGNRAVIFFSRALLHIPNGILTAGLALLAGALFLSLQTPSVSWAGVVASIIAVSISCACFALFLGCLAIIVTDWFYLFSGSQGLMILVSGVIIPTESLPPFLEALGFLLPVTSGLAAMRASFVGDDLIAVAPQLSLELGVGAAYAVFGFGLYKWIEARARRTGIREFAV